MDKWAWFVVTIFLDCTFEEDELFCALQILFLPKGGLCSFPACRPPVLSKSTNTKYWQMEVDQRDDCLGQGHLEELKWEVVEETLAQSDYVAAEPDSLRASAPNAPTLWLREDTTVSRFGSYVSPSCYN